jgi:hypothetical protein
MRQGTPGYAGIMNILGAVVAVGVLMTTVFGEWGHWLPILLALAISLRVIQGPRK